MKVVDCGFCHKEIAVSDNKFRESEDSIEILCPWCSKNLNYSKSDFKERHDYFSPLHQSSLSKESKFTFDISIWIKGLVILLIAGFFFYMFIEKIRTGSWELGTKYEWRRNVFTKSYSRYVDHWYDSSSNIWSNGSFYYWILVDFITIPSFFYLLFFIKDKNIFSKILLNIFRIILAFAIIATFIYTILNLLESIHRYYLFKSYLPHAPLGTGTIDALHEDMDTCWWVSLFCIIMLSIYYFPIFYSQFLFFKEKYL